MTTDLDPRIRSYTRAVADAQGRIDAAEVRSAGRLSSVGTRGLPTAIAAALVVVTLIGAAALLVRFAPEATDVTATTVGSDASRDVVRSDASGATPFPDVDSAVPGDDGAAPLPLGVISTLPDSVRLDFLFELCWTPNCFRDAHFMDPSGSGLGSGPFDPDTPFHVREGFPVTSDDPLGDGFDLVLYITPMDVPSEFDGVTTGGTVRFTPDYVVRGETDVCGPTYEQQTGPVACEWFVHDFPDGLPAGRHAIWAVWEAPCWAWVEYGFAEACTDPDEVMALFNSGFDSPFEVGATSYESVDGEMSGGVGAVFTDGNPTPDSMSPVADASGAASTGGTPVPDFATAVVGDPGGETLPLGTLTSPPDTVHLDFLFEICWPEFCFRDAHFMDPTGSGLGSGTFAAGEPFHIREGFPVTGDAPLGDGFDVVIYVTPMDVPGEFSGVATGVTIRYTADYMVRGVAAGCGPTYRIPEGAVTCEWFVHEFPDGLPAGRHALWAVWEAPCDAWIQLGFVEDCTDPGEVLSLFSSGFDAPFGLAPLYGDHDQRPSKAAGTGG
ncbi:MAG TPA: hypothetical protein VMS74_09055 [Acidimicrobiia bacterium]|nr:hypothetical protein [Acidimicrobiia bacterium]